MRAHLDGPEQPVALANTKKARNGPAENTKTPHLKLNVFAHGRTVLPKHCQGVSVTMSVIVRTYPHSHTHSGKLG